ncbi:MAG: FHA domain-containing protein [Myxococcota bacterium]
MYKLVISDDEGKTTVVPLVRDEISIGRQEGNTIRLTERNVSRRHALLRRTDEGYAVVDLESYNGIRVNGQRIAGDASLAAEDQVAIGDYVVTLKRDESARPPPEPTTETPSGPPARLVMLTPPAPGAEFALGRDGKRMGRAEDLDIWINHRSISREHAVVRVDGDQIRVVDLQSANGLRHNGVDVAEALLKPGDVLELGQVRFRFVGAGETYVFDPADALPIETIVDAPAPSRTPLVLALLILVVAVIGGAVIALGGDEGPGTAEGPAAGGAVAASPGARTDEALARCQGHVEAGRWADAIAAANEALGLDPASPDAETCRRQAQDAQMQAEAFDACVAAHRAGEIDEAYFACAELDADSALAARPQVRDVALTYAAHHLELAEAAADAGDAEGAAREARIALTVENAAPAVRARAEELAAGAEVTEPTPRPGRGVRRPRVASARAAAPEEAPEVAPEPAARVDPREVVRECSYDNRCIARNLAGRANSPQTLSLLIETYRQLGNTGAMQREMRSFVRRYPDDARAERYRQQLP